MNKMKLLGIPALRTGDIKDPSAPQVWVKVATCLHGSGGELCPPQFPLRKLGCIALVDVKVFPPCDFVLEFRLRLGHRHGR